MKAFVFPGQGSQYVGMGRAVLDSSPQAQRIFEIGEKITGIPLKNLCLKGPLSELTRTLNLQPALTAVNIAIYETMLAQGIVPDVVAGHSLGEYSALYAAQIVNLEDVFRLVMKRGEVMEQAAQKYPGAMYAVIGLSRDKLEILVKETSSLGIIAIANHNSPEQLVITGQEEPVSLCAKKAKEKGARVIRLKVNGGYHSPLMAEAAQEFSSFLKGIEFKPPQKTIFFNVSASSSQDPHEIKSLMGQQIESPVRWVEEAENMYKCGVRCFLEIGPKKVLGNLLKKILADKEVTISSIEDPFSLDLQTKGICL